MPIFFHYFCTLFFLHCFLPLSFYNAHMVHQKNVQHELEALQLGGIIHHCMAHVTQRYGMLGS